MDELYMEQVVKTKTSLLIRVINALLFLASVISCFAIVFRTEMFLVASAFAFFGYRFSMMFKIEYEYLHEKELLWINKIDGWNKKRKAATVNLEHLELLAPMGNYRLDAYQGVETFDFSAKDPQDPPYVMVVNSKDGMKKLLLQFNEDMVESFKNRMPRKVFSD